MLITELSWYFLMWCKQYWHNPHLISMASLLDMEYIPRHLCQHINAVQSSVPQGDPLSTVYMITMEMNLHEDRFCGIRTLCTKIDGISSRGTAPSCYLHIFLSHVANYQHKWLSLKQLGHSFQHMWDGWYCVFFCDGHHWRRGKTTKRLDFKVNCGL